MAEIKYAPLDKTILAALVGEDRFAAHQEVVEAARRSGEEILVLIKKNPLFAHYLASIGGDCRITVEAGNDGEISLIWDGSKKPKKPKKLNPPPLPGGTLSNSKGPTMKALRARAEALGVDISDLGVKRTAIAQRLAEHESWDRVGVEAAVAVASLPSPSVKAEEAPVIVTPSKSGAPPEKKVSVASPMTPKTRGSSTSLEDALGDLLDDASETLSADKKEDADEVIVETYVPIRRAPRIRTGHPVEVKVVDLAAKIQEAADLDLKKALSEEVGDEMIE